MNKAIIILALFACTGSAQDYKSFIAQWEGYRNEVYICPAGYPTIGIGHKLAKGENFTYLPDSEISYLFEQDLKIALLSARQNVFGFDDRPEIVKLIMVDFFFNLGETRGRKFVKMLRACNELDYLTMAEELKDSKWYHQVGNRSKHHVKKIRQLGLQTKP